MKPIYNEIGNTYETTENAAYITVLKKDGTELVTKVDIDDLDTVKEMGTWYAEWNKDYNDHIVQNVSKVKKNKKGKPLKQSLASFLLNVSPKAPIVYLNGDTLDNRRINLDIAKKETMNEVITKDDHTLSIVLKDRIGKIEGYASISPEDLNLVINDTYTWVLHKTHGRISVVANTPEGRIPLYKVLLNPESNQTIHFKNGNSLDNRRANISLVTED